MKKRLFNIHKLIGINIILFFFISLFFGALTIFQPYINLWEDKKKHFSTVEIENVNLDKCIKQVTKRTYVDENGQKMRKDFIKLNLAALEVRSTNLLQVKNRPNFYLDPNTCKRVRPKNFTISKFFDKIHTGRIFNSLLVSIIFGFASVAIVFLSISGIYLVIKNHYKNGKTKTVKGFFAKYHRLLLLYTLPLVFMFGVTGALFNLGVYSSPVITSYLTNGETSNVLKVEKNILVDKDLELLPRTKDVKTLNLNELYSKAKKQFSDIKFYEMQVYNYNDINAKVKFIGYEPNNYFISSIGNETYITLNGVTGQVINKKMAKDGSFTEKTLDSIFYLHYLRTFSDIPRIVFAFVCLVILFGIGTAMLLWLHRAKQDKFSYKVLNPSIYTLVLGSLLSASALFATSWTIPKQYLHFTLYEKLYNTQEVIFYAVFALFFIYVLIRKNQYKIIRDTLILSAIFLLTAVISHNMVSEISILSAYSLGLTEIFFVDIALLITSILLLLAYEKLPLKYFVKP